MEQIDDSETESIGTSSTNTLGVATTSVAINFESWPLTGVPADEVGNWPILVVKIDNHDRARPQYGLNAADVVFEEIVEGGLTRLAALYHSNEAALVGPIRSVRTSDFNLLQNLNRPLFANSGGNEDVLRLLQDINFVDVSSNAARGVYRRLEERPSPHNLVSDTKSLRAVGADRSQGGHLRSCLNETMATTKPKFRASRSKELISITDQHWCNIDGTKIVWDGFDLKTVARIPTLTVCRSHRK